MLSNFISYIIHGSIRIFIHIIAAHNLILLFCLDSIIPRTNVLYKLLACWDTCFILECLQCMQSSLYLGLIFCTSFRPVKQVFHSGLPTEHVVFLLRAPSSMYKQILLALLAVFCSSPRTQSSRRTQSGRR